MDEVFMGIELAKVLTECTGHSIAIAGNGMDNLMER